MGLYSVGLWIQLMKKEKITWSFDHLISRNCADICFCNCKKSWTDVLEFDLNEEFVTMHFLWSYASVSIVITTKLWLPMLLLADPRSVLGRQAPPPPPLPRFNFFYFHVVFGKLLPSNRVGAPLWEILWPPLVIDVTPIQFWHRKIYRKDSALFASLFWVFSCSGQEDASYWGSHTVILKEQPWHLLWVGNKTLPFKLYVFCKHISTIEILLLIFATLPCSGFLFLYC